MTHAEERHKLRRDIEQCMLDLGRDELRVLRLVAQRLTLGHDQYGPLDIEGDKRNWMRELTEELIDGLVYASCQTLRGEP